MSDIPIIPGAEPFFFAGSDIGVLVSHGFTGSPQSMRFLGEYLAQEGGFTVAGPLLTGHGTAPEEMARASAEDWIRDLERALALLRERCRKVFMTGLSMGGTLTLYMAGMYPDAFAGIAPINAAIFLRSPDLAALTFMPGAPPFVPGIGSDIKQPGVTELAYPLTPVPSLRQLFALMTVARELLPRVTCPALIFQSRDDHVVNPANAPAIEAEIGATQKELVWLENSYHVATLDNDKELIAARTLAFIRQQV